MPFCHTQHFPRYSEIVWHRCRRAVSLSHHDLSSKWRGMIAAPSRGRGLRATLPYQRGFITWLLLLIVALTHCLIFVPFKYGPYGSLFGVPHDDPSALSFFLETVK